MPASLGFLFSYKAVIHIRVRAAACWVLPLQRATRHPCGQELEGTLQLPLFPRSPGKAVGCRSSWEHPCSLWSWDGLSAALGWLLVAFRISWPPLFSQDSVLCPAPAPSLSVHRRLPWFVVAPLNATEQKLPCSISYSLCLLFHFLLFYVGFYLACIKCPSSLCSSRQELPLAKGSLPWSQQGKVWLSWADTSV